jgi:hypothetical protein
VTVAVSCWPPKGVTRPTDRANYVPIEHLTVGGSGLPGDVRRRLVLLGRIAHLVSLVPDVSAAHRDGVCAAHAAEVIFRSGTGLGGSQGLRRGPGRRDDAPR